MVNSFILSTVVFTGIVLLGSCDYYPARTTKSASTVESAKTDSLACRTYGFRNWSVEESSDSVTVGGEASMPTPDWKVILHHVRHDADGSIELSVETIEPAGLSSSVISWVAFETTVSTPVLEGKIFVRCADDLVFTTGDKSTD